MKACSKYNANKSKILRILSISICLSFLASCAPELENNDKTLIGYDQTSVGDIIDINGGKDTTTGGYIESVGEPTMYYNETMWVEYPDDEGTTLVNIISHEAGAINSLCYVKHNLHDEDNGHRGEICADIIKHDEFFGSDSPALDMHMDNIVCGTLDNMGNEYYLQHEYDNQNDRLIRTIQVFDSMGLNIKTININDDGQDMVPFAVQIFVVDGLFCLIKPRGITVVNNNGDIVHNVEYGVNCIGASDGKNIYLAYYRDKSERIVTINKLDIQTLETVWSVGKHAPVGPLMAEFNANDGMLYIISDNVIERCEADGSNWEKVMDLRDFRFGKNIYLNYDRMLICSQIYFLNKNSFYLVMASMTDPSYGAVYLYELQEANEQKAANENNGAGAETKHIKISLPSRDVDLERIAILYTESNPDIKIVLDSYRNEISDEMSADYIQYINTKILAGDCDWDIIPILFLPYREFIKKGLFANIDEIKGSEALDDDSKYYANIVNACRSANGLHYIPERVSFYALSANINGNYYDEIIVASSSNWLWGDLYTIAARIGGNSLGSFFPGIIQADFAKTSITYAILKPYYNKFMNMDDSIDMEKEIMECFEMINLFKDDSIYTSSNTNISIVYSSYLTSLFQYNTIDFIESHMVIPMPSVDANNYFSFDLQSGYAIMNDSMHKEESLDFMLFVLDNRLYQMDSILRSDVEAAKERALGTFAHEEALNSRLVNVMDAFYDSYANVKGSLNDAIYFDTIIYYVIEEIVSQFMDNTLNSEAAARAVADRLWLYKNE